MSRTNWENSGGNTLIENNETGIMTISSGEFSIVGSSTVINNKNKLTITGGTFDSYGRYVPGYYSYYYYGTIVNNSLATSDLVITGGTYGTVAVRAALVNNVGTARIENITSNLNASVTNSGTIELIDVVMENLSHIHGSEGVIAESRIYNTGSMTITGGNYKGVFDNNVLFNVGNGLLEATNTSFTTNSNSGYNASVIYLGNNSDTTFENVEINQNVGNSNGILMEGASTLTMNNSIINHNSINNYDGDSYRSAFRMATTGSVNINNTNIISTNYSGITRYGTGTLVLNNVNTARIYNTSSGLIDLNNSEINVSNGDAINNSGSGTINVNSGSYISSTSNGIYNSGTGTINVGVSGGIPSVTDPVISGKTYGLYNDNNNSSFNFYDGIIKGETGSIYGTINETEAGYKEKRDEVTVDDITTTESTLTVVGDTERVAVVNNINFSTLQSAVNYAVRSNVSTITMYKSVTLEDNLVKPEGIEVNIYLNNYTITTGDYTIDSGINIISGQAPGGLGGKIYRFLANITGTEINPKNIVIYQMNDGISLDASKTYKLYKLIDNNYKIVKVREEELGEYTLGYDNDEIRTNRGRIYINDIGEGNYKLVSSDNKELVFEIGENEVSSNIRINTSVKANRTSTSIAKVILSLQTGVVRYPFILVIMVLIIVILSLVAYKKTKEN